jgi:hypothetical protein
MTGLPWFMLQLYWHWKRMAWLRMTDYRLKLSFSQQRAPTVCEAIPSFTQFLHAMFECNVQYLSMTLKKIFVHSCCACL